MVKILKSIIIPDVPRNITVPPSSSLGGILMLRKNISGQEQTLVQVGAHPTRVPYANIIKATLQN